MLPAHLQPLVMGYIDRLNEEFLLKPEFWSKEKCYSASVAILDVANRHFSLGWPETTPKEIPELDQDTAFGLFQIASLSFAYTAVDQLSARRFMGIRKSWIKE